MKTINTIIICLAVMVVSGYFGFEARKRATDNLVAVVNVAGLDGSENGVRIRAVVASTWGGQITNIAILRDHVVVMGTEGSRQWWP